MISSYLSSRQLVYNTSSRPQQKHISLGAAQGSILSPDLWNVNYDGILRRICQKELFCFDTSVVTAAVIMLRNTEEVQRKLRRVMLRTKTWLDSHGLDLTMHKTDLLLITGRLMDMSVGNEVIRT